MLRFTSEWPDVQPSLVLGSSDFAPWVEVVVPAAADGLQHVTKLYAET